MSLNSFTAKLVKRALKSAPGSRSLVAKHEASKVAQRSLVTLASSTFQDSAQATNRSAFPVSARPVGGGLSGNEHALVRSFASYPPNLNAFPQYSVFGETCMLGLRVMLPAFRLLKNNALVVDASKRGRLVLEWLPRDADGKINRARNAKFALSPEECGLLVDQLKKNEKVVFLRRVHNTDAGYSYPDATADTPDKVLHVTPGQGGMTSFKVDFEKDGVGGHDQGGSYDRGVTGPLEVVVQTGELQVMLRIIETSIPQLTGWTTMMDISMNRVVNEALTGGGSADNGGPNFSTSDGSGSV